MSAVKLIVEIGVLAIPPAGAAIDGGMSMSNHAKAEKYPRKHADVDL